jgi:hypothetical protein
MGKHFMNRRKDKMGFLSLTIESRVSMKLDVSYKCGHM